MVLACIKEKGSRKFAAATKIFRSIASQQAKNAFVDCVPNGGNFLEDVRPKCKGSNSLRLLPSRYPRQDLFEILRGIRFSAAAVALRKHRTPIPLGHL